jgi:hypothetical protein
MKMIQIVSLSLLLLTGCQTTPEMRQRAADLTTQLSAYRDSQADRVEKINNDYHQAFSQLIGQLTDIKTAQLDLDRDIQSQRIADHIIADINNTLRQTFRDAFGEAVSSQRTEIAQADLAIAAARDAYAQSYTDAKLKMDDLDKVISNLRVLSAAEDQQQSALSFIETLVKVHQKIMDDAKQNQQTQKQQDQKTDAATTPKK